MILKNIALAGLLSFWVVIAAYGQQNSSRIDEYVTAFVKTGDFSGCVLITEGEEVLYENCFGEANRSFGVANSSRTRFWIGSVSKQFTAGAILILEEKGLLKSGNPGHVVCEAKFSRRNPGRRV